MTRVTGNSVSLGASSFNYMVHISFGSSSRISQLKKTKIPLFFVALGVRKGVAHKNLTVSFCLILDVTVEQISLCCI